MEEEARGNQTNCFADKKNNSKCIINVFCNDKKYYDMDDGRKNDGHCIINIFCNEVKHENMGDCNKNDNNCVINIFCNDKTKDEKCNGENDW